MVHLSMFKIVVITPETGHPHESHVLEILVKEYGCMIHIRKPSYDKESYTKYLQNHNHLLDHFVLHEHHSLAKEFQVKGIHLKEKDRNHAKWMYEGINVVSTSIHTIEDTARLQHPFEYFFYSPLFESISKEGYGTNKTYEVLKETVFELKKRTSIPIIGLGGIQENNIVLVQESGFDGAALLGAVWEQDNPLKSFERIASTI